MRLYLAIAVLMLALVAYTEAQEETFGQTVTRITEQVTRATQDLGEKFKAGFNDFQNSDIAVSANRKFSEFVEWAKAQTQGN